MSDLLTHDEYRAIADGLTPATTSFIDGSFRRANGGGTFDTVNPATGAVIASVASCDESDVDFAVAKAREAFDDGRWRCLHPSERKQVLIRLAKLIRRNRHELAVLESLDSGKPVRDCAEIDIPETVNTLIWHAEAIDKLDQTAPVGEDAMALVVREPIGVVGAVLPEFQAVDDGLKIAPGLPPMLDDRKSAEQTSLSALRVAELAMEPVCFRCAQCRYRNRPRCRRAYRPSWRCRHGVLHRPTETAEGSRATPPIPTSRGGAEMRREKPAIVMDDAEISTLSPSIW